MVAVPLRHASHVEHVMGTSISIDVRDQVPGAVVDAAIAEAIAWLHDVDATWSTYNSDSPISRFGRGQLRVDDLPESMHEVLDLCDNFRVDTGGAFDIHVPAPNGTRLETSGLVKGWSIERCASILEAHRLENFCINAGGDIAMRGVPNNADQWRIGIRHPDITDRLALHVESHGGPLAVATSATYERGQHIVDPRDGLPAHSGVCSVTIIGPDLTFADVYATALFVIGVEGATWLHDTHPDYGAYIIDDSRQSYSTPTFDRYRVN